MLVRAGEVQDRRGRRSLGHPRRRCYVVLPPAFNFLVNAYENLEIKVLVLRTRQLKLLLDLRRNVL
jgi:hypothetical protein